MSSSSMDYSWIEEARRAWDYDAFRARLRNAIKIEGYLWTDICAIAGLPHAGTRSAIEGCEDDFVPILEILEKLAAPLGRTARWLVTGESVDNDIVVGLRERTHSLIDEFAYKQELTREDCQRLHKFIDGKLNHLFTQTPQAVYRVGIPETWRDVRYLYEEMISIQG